MLVNETRRDQGVISRLESGRANIRHMEGREHVPLASLIQHLGGGINPIDLAYTLVRQPCGSAHRSAPEIRAAFDGAPLDALNLAEQWGRWLHRLVRSL